MTIENYETHKDDSGTHNLKKDLVILNDIKSNKHDTEQIMRGVDILHKQLSHLIVLFVE